SAPLGCPLVPYPTLFRSRARERAARRRRRRGGRRMITPPLLADPAVVSAGDTAWVLTSTALVMVMTVGLAFFYGGLVRPKNALRSEEHTSELQSPDHLVC